MIMNFQIKIDANDVKITENPIKREIIHECLKNK